MFYPVSRYFFLFTFGLSVLGLAADARTPVVFDTDMGSDCDDVGALALLHAYADEGLVEILACVFSSGKVPYGAGVMDAINVYYGRPEIPVGADHELSFGDPVDKMSAEKLAKDQAAFGNRIVHNHDAEEQVSLLRRVLADAEDSSVVYITVGHTKGLHDLMISSPDEHSPLSGRQLIERKVNRWVALGALWASNPDGHRAKDWNFFRNGAAPYTDVLLEQWPVEAYFIDAGTRVMTGESLKDTPPGNILRTAYRDWLWWHEQRTLEDQRPSWDLAAVYFGVLGVGQFLEAPRRGYMDFDPEEGSLWLDGGKGEHRLVMGIPEQEGAFADYLNERIAREPGNR